MTKPDEPLSTLTKREFFSIRILESMIRNPLYGKLWNWIFGNEGRSICDMNALSVKYADGLIKALSVCKPGPTKVKIKRSK